MRIVRIVFAVIASTSLIVALGGCPPTQPSDGNTPDANNTPPPTTKTRHERIFTEIIPGGYTGPGSCQICHSDKAADVLQTAHWKWRGTNVNIVDAGGAVIPGEHGQIDLFNAFYFSVAGNEARCAQCHPTYGNKDKTLDFASAAQMDCLVCHDTTGTYRKSATADGGGGTAAVVVNGVETPAGPEQLKQVVYNVGTPTRQNCGQCHFYADGGDAVKRPDLPTALANPTAELDVHMGGQGFSCQACHTMRSHGIAGQSLHSVDEGDASPDCMRCHGERPHRATIFVSGALNFHTSKVACQTCHIPAFARATPTRMEWYWDAAGDTSRTPALDQNGQPDYDPDFGRFVSGKNVRPVYRWFDGQWRRKIVNVNDTYANAGTATDPVVLAEPAATINTPGAKVYPFKRFVGTQPADTVAHRLVVPHLFGAAAGSNPFWTKYDWAAAIAEGTAYAGQPYSGTYGFVNTVSYLAVNHEIAPRAQALQCFQCHGVPGFFEALGYAQDPFQSQ